MTQLDLKRLREVAETAQKADTAKAFDLPAYPTIPWELDRFLANFQPGVCLAILDALERRWIPVSERMPTHKEAGYMGAVLALYDDGQQRIVWLNALYMTEKIKAWQTLPDPPEGK